MTRPAGSAGLLRVRELSERAEVPLPTIKFYIRERLLPAPRLIVGRNVGYYDPALVDRLRVIKKLREERFLPLRVIRAMLADRDSGTELEPGEASLIAEVKGTVLGAINSSRVSEVGCPVPGSRQQGDAGALSAEMAAAELTARPMNRREVIERFRPGTAEEIDVLEAMGLLAPEGRGAERRYGADDLRLLEALRQCHDAGLSRELFPIEGIGHYAETLGDLVAREVKLFARSAEGRMSKQTLQKVAERVLAVTEPMILLVRRNLMRKALREIAVAPSLQPEAPKQHKKKEKAHVG
ncbi:MAG: MerR family transcriptional regulator [Deltaproteobacteria bacterium]|nr:MerR family transcriptional regulator [Deltaproteobacteria bacterium]